MHPGMEGPLRKLLKNILSQDKIMGDSCIVVWFHGLEFDPSREIGVGREGEKFLRLFPYLQILPSDKSASTIWS